MRDCYHATCVTAERIGAPGIVTPKCLQVLGVPGSPTNQLFDAHDCLSVPRRGAGVHVRPPAARRGMAFAPTGCCSHFGSSIIATIWHIGIIMPGHLGHTVTETRHCFIVSRLPYNFYHHLHSLSGVLSYSKSTVPYIYGANSSSTNTTWDWDWYR